MKVFVVYGTTTGNTELMAEEIGKILSENHEVTVKNITDSSIQDFLDFDCILAGSSTWQDGELQDDWLDFEHNFKNLHLSNKKIAVFGPGSTGYPQFAKAVELLENLFLGSGATILAEHLKIDGDVEEQMETVKNWAKNVSQKIDDACLNKNV